MGDLVVDVFDNGAVRLGKNTICDGYAHGFKYRIQTHIHDDHMNHFNRSKGIQDLFMTPETRLLLIAEMNAELEYRDNLIAVEQNVERKMPDGSVLTLVRSGHMLGASQVVLELPNGLRCGYSGDFSWPLEDVIQVEQLVVDSTYGGPSSIRKYSQGDAEGRLQEVVCQSLRSGSVHICAHRGTIERVIHILGANIDVPILVSPRLCREVQVYQNYGFAVAEIVDIESEEGKLACTERRYVRLYAKGDGFQNELVEGTTVICSAFMASTDDPLLMFSDRAYRVALSNHADFYETLSYIEASGASIVVTDNTRSHGVELAIEVNRRLSNVFAIPSTNEHISF